MKNTYFKKSLLPMSLALATGFAACGEAFAQSAEPMVQETQAIKFSEWCKESLKMHEDYLKFVKAQDQEISSQIGKLKEASAGKKVDLLVSVVSLIAKQQTDQHDLMEKMCKQMSERMEKQGCSIMGESMGKKSTSADEKQN
jgi:gas vesicle protein